MRAKLFLSVCLFLLISLQLLAQRTITNRGYGGKVIEQYTINENGDKHGVYKAWNKQGTLIKNYNYQNGELHGDCLLYFENGTIKEKSTHYKGIMTSLKVYQYNQNGNKRTLIRDATWDRLGNPLIDGDNAGKLPNGRWRFNYPKFGDYSETYDNNDTLYIWDDRAKKRFLGKQIQGRFIEHKSQLEIELSKRDSIQNNRDYSHYTQDSLISISTKYIEKLSAHFGNKDGNQYNSNEKLFYELICKELKSSDDKYLVSLIIDALDLHTISDVRNLELHCVSSNKYSARIDVAIGNLRYPLLYSCNGYYGRLQGGYGAVKKDTQSKVFKILDYIRQ